MTDLDADICLEGCAHAQNSRDIAQPSSARELRLGGLRYTPTAIRNLRLPFQACLSLLCGEASLIDMHRRQKLRQSKAVAISPLSPFSLELLPRAIVEIKIYDEYSSNEHKPYRLYSRSLARLVFLSPSLNWTRERFAASMSMTVANISRRIFAEGMSFREVVLASRLARILVDQSTGQAPLSPGKNYGFTSRALLENSVYDCFGLSLPALLSSIKM